MRSRSFLLLFGLALTCVVGFPSTNQAQDKREIATEPRHSNYLFFQGDEYLLSLKIPEKDIVTDALIQVSSFDVKRKFIQKGLLSFPDMKLECGGITYTVPAHKALVLGKRPTAEGFHIDTAPDPNGSGNVELLINYDFSKSQTDGVDLSRASLLSKDIVVVDFSGESGGSAGKMDVMLRNKTDAPFTITREFFKNLPTVEKWPEIVIPPAKGK